MLKVAQYAAQLEDYDKAIQIYESVAGSCLDSSLLKYSAKEYFFRAALCHLCVDLLNATHALDKYAHQYPAFQDSREFKLIKVKIDFKKKKKFIILKENFYYRHSLSIWRNKISMAILKLLRTMTVFHVWINGTLQSYCVLKSNIMIIQT